MSDMPGEAALAAEFDCLMARARLTVPPERRGAILKMYADLRAQIALLYGRHTAADEPSNVFRLTPRKPG